MTQTITITTGAAILRASNINEMGKPMVILQKITRVRGLTKTRCSGVTLENADSPENNTCSDKTHPMLFKTERSV